MPHRQEVTPYKMKHNPCNLCILENPETHQLLMIKHLRGINKGYCNFPGGKIDLGESIPESVEREVREETGLNLQKSKCVGRVDIVSAENLQGKVLDEDDLHIYLFYSDKYSGTLEAAQDEVELFWCDKDKIPFDKMRDNDKVWIPDILQGKMIHKVFYRGTDGKLKETMHDDEDVEGLLQIRMFQYDYMKQAMQVASR